MAHTPGPWFIRVLRTGYTTGFTIDTKDAEIEICEIFPKPNPVAVNRSNAHLIAAAPDLLEAAVIGLSYIKSECGTDTTDYDFVLNSIKKARGE